jgi:hypothetical protein
MTAAEAGNEPRANSSNRALIELFILSFLSLFIELLFIRWMSADIRLFNIFKNFPLVACFVGLGVGCAQPNDRWFRSAAMNMLGFVLLVKFLLPITGLAQLMPANLASYNWFDPTQDAMLPAFQVTLEYMVLLIGILAAPFFVMACIGSRIGLLFNENKPLAAYAVNIMGAIVGSIAFSAFSFFNISPSTLFAAAALILGGAYFASRSASSGKLMPILAGVATVGSVIACFWPIPTPAGVTDLWSPYQHLTLVDMAKFGTEKSGKPHYELMTNGRDYQHCWDRGLQDEFTNIYWSRCFMPYRLRPQPQDVAVVAAGMGMDVQAALEGGAKNIEGVDIDPVILGLGKELNPNKPYAKPNVNVLCDDARHFFRTTQKKYDLVIFSHLDSHTVIGQSSSVRLDNFVYTKESFQRALSMLKPDGLMVVVFNSRKDWFRDRMYKTIEAAAGYAPLIFKDKADEGRWSFFCVAGPPVAEHKLTQLPSDVEPLDMSGAVSTSARVLTDDWPYLYVNNSVTDWTYILICGELLILALIVSRGFLLQKTNAGLWQLFFLGAGFMLLELQSISRLALIYGTTWITSSIVINGILVMILLANMLVIRYRPVLRDKYVMVYSGLFVSLAVSYLLPTDQILNALPGIPGAIVVSVLTLLPMFVAGLIFPTFFAEQANSGIALAYNMLGSVIGAFLEYQSNFTGINSVVLLSIVLYALSFACLLRAKRNS